MPTSVVDNSTQYLNNPVMNKAVSSDEGLDISALPLGIYTLKITSGEQVWMERIVKK